MDLQGILRFFVNCNMSSDKQKSVANNTVQEQVPDYAKAEMDLLKEALKRTYTERFLFATQLYKIGQTLSKAVITHRPDTFTK